MLTQVRFLMTLMIKNFDFGILEHQIWAIEITTAVIGKTNINLLGSESQKKINLVIHQIWEWQ